MNSLQGLLALMRPVTALVCQSLMVLEEDRRVGLAGERAVVAGLDERPRLALLAHLAGDELLDVGMVDVENDHLRGATGGPTTLDDTGECIEALHEGHRPARGATAGQRLIRRPDRRQVGPRPAAVLEEHALGLGQRQDRLHRVLDRVDEARRSLILAARDSDVEPHRAVEAHLLMEQQVGQLVLERLRIGLGCEVAAFTAPLADGVRNPRDHLLHAGLAPWRAQLAAEVLADYDVCGHL
jgi:hypothetical protein